VCLLIKCTLLCFIELGAVRRAIDRNDPDQQLTHPLGELLCFPPDIERQLSVIWALGKNEKVAAITKRDYENLDLELLE
jgi:hypothetical protein